MRRARIAAQNSEICADSATLVWNNEMRFASLVQSILKVFQKFIDLVLLYELKPARQDGQTKFDRQTTSVCCKLKYVHLKNWLLPQFRVLTQVSFEFGEDRSESTVWNKLRNKL